MAGTRQGGGKGMALAIGIDLGGTKVEIVVIDEAARS
jgi:predicted NBD/HSP70 family sugar kinase